MMEAMSSVAKLGVALNEDERRLLSVAYERVFASKAASWRVLSLVKSLEEEIGNSDHVTVTTQKMKTVEKEITDICHGLVATIDDHLLKLQNTPDAAVFYHKMKGDYYHYLAEFKSDEEQEEAKSQAEKAYTAAKDAAEKDLAPNDPVRLGLAMNFSVFQHEMQDSTHRYIVQRLRQQRPAPATAPASPVAEPLAWLMGSLTCAAVICETLSKSVEAVTEIMLREKKNQSVYDAAVGASFAKGVLSGGLFMGMVLGYTWAFGRPRKPATTGLVWTVYSLVLGALVTMLICWIVVKVAYFRN
ncbi:14-3-3 domain-containing protein [Tanacetum coccineum]